MLGSERGVVEEWLSEFKVKALFCSVMTHADKNVPLEVIMDEFLFFPESTPTVGVTTMKDLFFLVFF